MGVWVQATSIVYIEENGRTVIKHPGDWMELGKQQAKEELAKGTIRILRAETLRSVQDLTDCSIYLRGHIQEFGRAMLEAKYPGIPVLSFQDYPKEGRFLVWDMSAPLRHELILTGFGLLNKWQMAVPLISYDTLAENMGSAAEQAETKTIIHDLRVPVYNPKIIFGRQGEEVRRLFELWDGKTELSFLRSLYQARPIINALPPSWVL